MHERLRLLFWKFHNQTISREEMQELEGLLLDPALEKETGLLLKELWEQQQESELAFFEPQPGDRVMAMLKEAQPKEKPAVRTMGWRRALMAASVLLVIGAGGYLVTRSSGNKEASALAPDNGAATISGLPGGDKAVLRLGDGRSILLDTAHKGALAQHGPMQILKSEEGLLSFAPLLGDMSGDAPALPVQWNTLSTPRGGQYQLVLADGTRVWLNAATELRFPAAFTGKERLVELSGEAYFEVEKDPSKPFRVRLDDKTVIEVLGTHFAITSYGEEGMNRTTLVEGAVKVTADEQTTVLKPGEQLTRAGDGSQRLATHVNTEQVIAWKNGLFDFTNADLKTISRQLERWYRVEIVLEGAVADKHISGIISRNNNLDTVLKMLEFTAGIRSRTEGSKLILY